MRPFASFLRGCLALVCLARLFGAEAALELPEVLVPGVVVRASVILTDAPARGRIIEIPALDGLVLQQQSGTDMRVSVINGQQTRIERLHLALRADRTGTFAIPAMTVRLADGSTLTTKPASLEVGAGDPTLVGEAVFSLSFSPEEAVVGERVRLTYRLAFADDGLRYERLGIAPPAEARVIEESELVTARSFAADGSLWRIETKTWLLAFDQPATVHMAGQQEFIPCSRDLFGSWARNGQSRRQAVPPVRLLVKELPTEGRPADYDGLLGQVEARAVLDRQRLALGEGTRLMLVLSGDQVDHARQPAPPEVLGLRLIPRDPEPDAPGERTFSWDLVPTTIGTIVIPPFRLSSFDAAHGGWQRVTTDPLTLIVLPGHDSTLAIVGATRNPAVDTPVCSLPQPVRGAGGMALRPWWGLGLIGLGAVLGLGWQVRERLGSKRPRILHRGRALQRALEHGDLDAAAASLHALSPVVAGNPHLAEAHRVLGERVDRARFGQVPLGDPGDEVRRLGEIP